MGYSIHLDRKLQFLLSIKVNLVQNVRFLLTVQLIDMYTEYDSQLKKTVDYNSINRYIHNYMQTIRENF